MNVYKMAAKQLDLKDSSYYAGCCHILEKLEKKYWEGRRILNSDRPLVKELQLVKMFEHYFKDHKPNGFHANDIMWMIDADDFEYDSSFNPNFNKNKLKEIKNRRVIALLLMYEIMKEL